MSLFGRVEVVLVGGPLDGERREVGVADQRRSFVEPLDGTGPLGFPLVTMHDYAVDAAGVWRYVKPEPPEPLGDPHGFDFYGRAA